MRSVDYRDTDRIVTLLTEDFGKIGAVARGARKSHRRFGGALQPYVLMQAELRKGRGELEHLQSVSVKRAYLNILRDLDAVAAAGAGLASIRERLPDHEPAPEIFETTLGFLDALDRGLPCTETSLSFQIRVLAFLGFAPVLDQCVRCGKLPPAGSAAQIDAARGGIVCQVCGGGSKVLSAASLRRWIAVQATSDYAEGSWPDKEREQIQSVLAWLDAHHATVSVRERTRPVAPTWEGPRR